MQVAQQLSQVDDGGVCGLCMFSCTQMHSL
jgi:hypothetical protein